MSIATPDRAVAADVLVVLVGSDSPIVRAVSAVLQDWSAVGLVRDHVWLADAAGASPTARVVTAGGSRTVALPDHIADQRGLQRVRLCAVSVVGAGCCTVRPGPATELLTALRRQAPAVTPLHCLVGRYGGTAWDPAAVLSQWHNVLVAPDDAWDPRSVAAPLRDDTEDAAFVAHAAAGLAGVAGLWSGMVDAPLDAEPYQSGVVTPVRSFMRRLDTSDVSEALRARLSDMSRTLPRPHTARRALPRFGRPELACEEMAKRVFDRHADLFARARTRRAEQPELRPVGALAAVKMFGAFLLAALRNVPGDWLKAVLKAVAVGVQVGVFGSGSQYEVIVRGVTASGAAARAADVAVAAEGLSERAGEPLEQRVRGADRFWQDVVAGALTLGDGERHSVEPVLIDDEPGVVDRADRLAPDPLERFVIPSSLAAHVSVADLGPWDALGARLLADELKALVEDGDAPAREAGRTLEALGAWWAPRGSSYVVQVGTRLGRMLERAVRELAELLRAQRDRGAPAELDRSAAATSRAIRLMFSALLLVLAGVAVAGAVGPLTPVRAVLIGAGVTVLAALVAFGIFYRRQRALFQHLTAARNAAARRSPDRIAALAKVVRTAATLLVQYDCWAPVLGRFVHEPYGSRTSRSASTVRLAGRLPRAVGLGVVHADDEAVATTAIRLSAELFEPGWLGSQWERLLAAAPVRLGPAGVELRGEHDALYADPGAGPESLLRQWSDDIVRRGIGADADAQLWETARRRLLSRGWPALAAELFTSIETATWPHRAARDVHDDAIGFLHELLDTQRRPGAPDRFNEALFSPEINDEPPHVVRQTIVTASADLHSGASGPGVRRLEPEPGSQNGLDRFVLTTQLAAARSARLISLGARGAPDPEPPAGDAEDPGSEVLG